MKTHFILFVLAVCFGHTASAQLRETVPHVETKYMDLNERECSPFYKYGFEFGGIVDLENLIELDTIIEDDFRSCSKYAHRFKTRWSDSIYLNNKLFTIVNDKDSKTYELHITKHEQETEIIQLPVENPLPDVHEYYFSMLPYKNSVVVMMSDMYTTHFKILKYITDDKAVMTQDIEHTYVTHPEPNTDHHHPYLYYDRLTKSQMIFTSHPAFADTAKTVMLNMDDFSFKSYDRTSRGVILDNEEEELIGFVSVIEDYENRTNHFEIQMTNDEEYKFDLRSGMPACSFLLHDSLLYIANYHPIATGAGLHCLDLRTNKLIWSADVMQVNADHSQYSNRVRLSLYKDKLLMEGTEMNGEYLQVFDFKSGERLGAFGITDFSRFNEDD